MKRHLAPVLAALFVAGLIGLLVYGVSTRGTSHSIDDAIARGRTIAAPVRALPLLGSGVKTRRSLTDYRGRVVVLNFWASWCEPCRTEEPLLERTQRQIAPRRATVLGVDFRDTEPDAHAFVRRYGISYPSLRDTEGKLAHDYGTAALPETFVIDRRGRIVAAHRGQVDQRFLDTSLSRALGPHT
ncbi:MAG TPA: TlpA disulfide reductase family protein [Solirubrobacteraceae bacterium]|nr:TlpA disulfide reductase family protein [Solirubrobacteraceae bacterium]